MNAHLFTFVSVASVLGLVACSGATADPNGGSGGSTESSSTSRPATGSSEAGAASPPSGKAAPASPPSGKGTDPGADAPPADTAACVASCTTTLLPKCQGDATFCDDVCGSMGPAEIACLVAAPTCAKAEWATCEAANPAPGKAGDAGAAGGNGK